MVASGGLEGSCGGNEHVEHEDLSLVVDPGDKTSCVTLDKLPSLLECQLPCG